MFLQGHLGLDEIEEYLTLLPEYHALNRQLFDWADQLIKRVTRRLEPMLAESVDKHGRLTNNRGIIKMQKAVFDMIESFANFGYGTKRNSIVTHIENYVGQALITDIWYRVMADQRLQNQYRELLIQYVNSADRNFLQNLGHNFPGAIGLRAISIFNSSYFKHQSNLKGFLDAAQKDIENTENDANITQAINKDFTSIHEFSHFRKIYSITRKYGNTTVEIYGGEFDSDPKSTTIAYVKIAFPGSNPQSRLQPGPTLPDGKFLLHTTSEHDSFQLRIDRHTGKLLMWASELQLDDQVNAIRGPHFISEKEFLRMKALIYRMLREYLEGKPEDVDRVFFKPEQKTGSQQQETREQIEKVVPKETAPTDPDQSTQPDPTEKFKPTYTHKPFERPSRPEPATPVRQPEPQEEEQMIQDTRLDGSYGEEKVIATIVRITKMPPLKSARNKQRGKGSHVVVQGQNGARFPMPCHAGKDLSPAILKKCLQKLEIPYSVFKGEY